MSTEAITHAYLRSDLSKYISKYKKQGASLQTIQRQYQNALGEGKLAHRLLGFNIK